ncbi:hypothetical protein TIFTF001_038009 [Ficus carica]|uniref:Ubiquitin-like protease family profile domain-containing protein n=1 Tax=Ficus carica TaxID=3494 RepID=A0AA88E6N4_FICCA|nr:hypothetical protein TIFTF001_038009 [Ficus carica]
MISANIIKKGQGKAHTADHVSSSQNINVHTTESDALKTTSPNIGTGSQDDVFIDSDIGVVADMGVQAVMEFLTADKVIVSREDVEEEKNKIPKKKRVRLSRLGQWLFGPMTDVGSPSKAPSKLIYVIPLGLADEPPQEMLEEFREWIKKGLLKRTHPGAKVRALWGVYQKAPDKFDWGSCDSIFRIMLGVCVQSGSSWFDVNTLLIPIHLADLKHWALVKLDLTNWTIEVYDSLQHEGPNNFKVRERVECMSKFIPVLAERLNLLEFKPREPPGIHPIPVTIMKDIPQHANGVTVKCLQLNMLNA